MTLTDAQRRAQYKWQKKATVMISVRLQRGSDADIIAYLDGEARQTVIKLALREYMKNHPKETTTSPDKPFWEELEEEEN